ncbi:Uncharacterized protein Fot_21917 [Forsythia ovata]|uniref:Uncharacterized protein n=1 Tax=Forsythia ovata TaxID=205694 RepID=A0ABD1UW79_9LAMI
MSYINKILEKIVLPSGLPLKVLEEDIEVSDEDLQFVNENVDYAAFDTHYQHWGPAFGLNLFPTYGMDVPTMQIYAPQLRPRQDEVFGAWDKYVRSNLPPTN